MQHTATHCNALQYTVTYCNKLQHTTGRLLSLNGASEQLDALLKALSLHEMFSSDDKQVLL